MQLLDDFVLPLRPRHSSKTVGRYTLVPAPIGALMTNALTRLSVMRDLRPSARRLRRRRALDSSGNSRLECRPCGTTFDGALRACSRPNGICKRSIFS